MSRSNESDEMISSPITSGPSAPDLDLIVRRLLLYASHLGLGPEEAHQAVLNVFRKSLDRIHLQESASITTYLMSQLRADVDTRRRPYDTMAESLGLGTGVVANKIRNAMAALSGEEQQVLLLRFVEGKTIEEIAAASDRSFTSTAALVLAARQKLRDKLTKLVADE